MGFWEEHTEREAEVTRKARHPQDAPMECAHCHEVKDDVLLGICAGCFDADLGAKHHHVRDRLDGQARY
jgi:hypothetical protein